MSRSPVNETLQHNSKAEMFTGTLSSVLPGRTLLPVVCATTLGVALASFKNQAVGAQWAVVEREHKMATVQPIAGSLWVSPCWETFLLAVAAIALAAWCIYAVVMQHTADVLEEHEVLAWDPLELTPRCKEVELGHMGLLAALKCAGKAASSNCSTEAEATSEHAESSSEETLTGVELESTVTVGVASVERSITVGVASVERSTDSPAHLVQRAAAATAAAAAEAAEAVERAYQVPEVPERICKFEGSVKVHAGPHAGTTCPSSASSVAQSIPDGEDHGEKVETPNEAEEEEEEEEEEEQQQKEEEEETEVEKEEGTGVEAKEQEREEPAVAATATATSPVRLASVNEDEETIPELTPLEKSEPAREEAEPIVADSQSQRSSPTHGVRWSDCPLDDPAECEEVPQESSSSRASASSSQQRPPGVWCQTETAWPACQSVRPMMGYSPYGYPCVMPDPAAFGHPYVSPEFFGPTMPLLGMANSWGRTDIRHHGSTTAFSSKSAGASPRHNHGRASSQDSDGGCDDLSKKSSVKNGMSMQEIMETLSSKEEGRVVIARRIKQLGFKSGTHLRRHFQEHGDVEGVLVSHSHLQTRVRPASLAFAIMATEEGAKAVLAQGTEQVVKGVTITLSAFRRPGKDVEIGLENDNEK